MLEKSRNMQSAYIDIVKRAKRAGVRIAMGTDAGTNYNYHGNNAAEIVYLVEQGILSPLEAIGAATGTAARAIMVDGITGTLQAGKSADFVILDADPLENIRVLADPERISGVYLEGAKA
jgi:imidazolonepropionase-like amidohydrolase